MSKKPKSPPTMIADKLRAKITASGLNLSQLAVECGVAQPILFHFMTGSRSLTLKTVEVLAAYFGLTLIDATAKRKRRK